MKFTPQQIAQILETPLGRSYDPLDEQVLAERRKISEKYEELKGTPRFFSPEELRACSPGWLKTHPEGAMLIPGFTEASLEARAWWIKENLIKEA